MLARNARIVVEDGLLNATASFCVDGDVRWRSKIGRSYEWLRPDMDLWLPDLASRLDRLLARDSLLSNLQTFLALQGDGGIQRISGSKTADSVPWEAFVDRSPQLSDLHARFAPVRTPDGSNLPASPAPTGSPRILILVGEGGSDFNAANVGLRLTKAIPERIGDPGLTAISVRVAYLWDDIEVMAKEATPHLVVVYAHGRSKPTPAVLVRDKLWLGVGELADHIAARTTMPPHWVFVSCSVGENPSKDELARFPNAFRELSKRGIATMVAMRARVRPNVGEAFLLELLETLVAGQPMARAAAMARHALRASGLAAGRWDWAAPAVWARSAPDEHIRWSDAQAGLRAGRLEGLRVLRAGTRQPASGLADPGESQRERAAAWIDKKRVAVRTASSSSSALLANLSDICTAARTIHGRTIVPVIPVATHEGYLARLSGWANSVRGELPLDSANAEFAQAVEYLASGDAYEGLCRLLALPNAFVVIAEAPGLSITERALWDALKSAPDDTVLVVCGTDLRSEELGEQWVMDNIDALDDVAARAAAALQHAPISMGFWAALRRPMPPATLAMLAGEPVHHSLESGLLVAASGHKAVLSDSARSELRKALGADKIRAALNEYIDRRSASELSGWNSDVFDELVLFVDAGRDDEVASLATAICRDQTHWSETEWLRLAAVVDRPKVIAKLAPSIRLKIATTYVSRQLLEDGEKWLRDFVSSSDAEAAQCDMLRSEIAKARADVPTMWARLEDAIAILKREPAIHASLLAAYEMNYARLLLYFRHDAVQACKKFQELLAGLGEPDDLAKAETYAALKRNLAEGLFEFEDAGQPKNFEAARHHLAEAVAVAQQWSLLALASECLYSLAKLEESEGRPDVAINELNRCIASAKEAHYPLSHRIAQLRRYRVSVTHQGSGYDETAFRSLLRPLDALTDHAWAARYSAQSRMWAGTLLYRRGEYEPALQYLRDVVKMTNELPALSTKADLATLISANVGLRIVADKAGQPFSWSEFAERADVRELLATIGESAEKHWAGAN